MRSVDIPVNQSDLVDTLSSMRVFSAFRSTRDAAVILTLHAEFDDATGATTFNPRFGA